MPKPNNPTSENGRNVAEKNELAVLKAIHHFGHLRRTEIAMAAWPNSSKKSGYVMAGRTMARLQEIKAILPRTNILGGVSYILGAKGVRMLKDININSLEGYDLAVDGPMFYHRTFGTCYLLEKAKQGCSVYGEYAILKDWAPIKLDFAKQEFRKIPDGLVLHPGQTMGWTSKYWAADWIEVESAFKSYEEVEKAFSVFSRSPEMNKEGTVIFNRMVFLADSSKLHHHRIARYLKKYLRERPSLDANSFYDHIIVAMADIDVPLTWKSVKEYSIRDLINNKLVTEESDESDSSTD